MSSGGSSPGHVFDELASPGARDAGRHVAMRTSLVVVAPFGKVSGPFDLGRPKPARERRSHGLTTFAPLSGANVVKTPLRCRVLTT